LDVFVSGFSQVFSDVVEFAVVVYGSVDYTTEIVNLISAEILHTRPTVAYARRTTRFKLGKILHFNSALI